MSRLPRFGTALSALAFASIITGCVSPTARQGQVANLDKSDVGLAMRAQMALAGGQFETAVDLAERAVANKPEDAMMRALLGNVYFGAGRFASAEAAYRDTLTLVSNEPKIVLKLALVQIAQGKNGEALAFLDAARPLLEPADYGLALALAGRPAQAIAVLEPAARSVGADARIRQNLALAYGLAGDWTASRTIAAQDLPLDQLDSRIRQWMAMSKPVRPSDQVAALIGVTPAANDPGQPVRLALRDSEQRLAQLVTPEPAQPGPYYPAAETASAPPPVQELPPVMPEYQAPVMAAAFQAPAAAEVVAEPAAMPVFVDPAPPPPLVAALGMQIEAPAKPKPAKAAKPKAAKARTGNAGVVVQLGAYSSPTGVEAAWEQIAGRYNSLRNYVPTSARFDSAQGTVYRLSVKGFESHGEANSLCSTLRSKGANCFVRNVAGDSPVRFASR